MTFQTLRASGVDPVEFDTRSDAGHGSIETDVVLKCIRRYFGSEDAGEPLENKSALDPGGDRILSVAAYHGVIPLVRASLGHPRIEVACRRWAAHSVLYGHEVVRIHNHLSRNGLRVIAFKGPTLAARAYGNLWQRQIRDLDLLVSKDDIEKVLEVLCGLGYRLDSPTVGRDEVLRTEKHFLLVHENSTTKVELHWAISLPGLHFDMPFETLWKRRDYVSISGTPVPTPCPHDLLLILSVHGASHYWTSLKWVCDVAALIRRYSDAQWVELQAEAKRRGCLRMLLLAVVLARNVTGVLLPSAAEHEIERDATVNTLAREAFARFYRMGTPDFFERLFTSIRSREQFTHRAQIAGSYVRAVLTRDNGPTLPLSPVLNSLSWPRRLYGIRVRSWDKLPSLVAAVMGHR
jgi:hypothetical protein